MFFKNFLFNLSLSPFLTLREISPYKYVIREFVAEPGIENKAKFPIYLKKDFLLEEIIDFTIFPFINAI